jgi:hypothetical protein
MLLIKTRVAGGLVDGYHHCGFLYFSHTSPCFACCHIAMSRDKGLRHVTVSRDLPRGDCVTDSVKGCNHTLMSPSLCHSERAGIMCEPASCDSVTSACQRDTVT